MIRSLIDAKLRFNSRRIPVLKNTDIDAHAEILLGDYDASLLSEPREVNIDEFAEAYLGVSLHYLDLTPTGFIWGRMVFEDILTIVYDRETGKPKEEPIDANTIVIDNRLAEDPRKEHAYRSTVAHEGGHFIYHWKYYHDYYFQTVNPDQLCLPFPEENHSCGCGTFCNSKLISGKGPKVLKTDTDWLEHQAKHFSAAILMPATTVRMLLAEIKDQSKIVEVMSDIYNVSRESAQIRLDYLLQNKNKMIEDRNYAINY